MGSSHCSGQTVGFLCHCPTYSSSHYDSHIPLAVESGQRTTEAQYETAATGSLLLTSFLTTSAYYLLSYISFTTLGTFDGGFPRG